MEIKKDDFFKKYGISESDFNTTSLKWEDLVKIYENHISNQKSLSIISNYIFETLTDLTTVHSIRKRIKEPEHLIEKIIRKSINNPELAINIQNYHEIITDLIGVRVLHLYKEDWLNIHNKIISTWKTVEKPTANIRKGDQEEGYIKNGCEIREHKYGYRSVHYLIEFPCAKDSNKIVEIQVRTLFEEAWSEIDHTIRYPYDIDNPILAGYLVVFNSLAGSADQMGSFIKILKQELDITNKTIKEKDKIIKELRQEINSSKLDKQVKERINKTLNKITYNNDIVNSKNIKIYLDSAGNLIYVPNPTGEANISNSLSETTKALQDIPYKDKLIDNIIQQRLFLNNNTTKENLSEDKEGKEDNNQESE